MAVIALQRVRLRFRRWGAGAQQTHLQQIETIRRALEKSTWPLSKSDGKRAKPKVSFGPAISVGYESEAEYCDAELFSRINMATAPTDLQPHLPEGFALISAKSIPRFFPSLDQTLNAASYEVVSPLINGTSAKWEDFMKRENFMVTKKKGNGDVVVDARPCVRFYSIEGDKLLLDIRFGPGRTLKPERIMQAVLGLEDGQVEMGIANPTLKVKRLKMFFEKDTGELVEP